MMSEIEKYNDRAVEANRRDLKSRDYLTNLLGEQIDRNEILEAENVRLEEEQRKLIELLEMKS